MRYFINDRVTIDLEEVVAIVVGGQIYKPSTGESGYSYEVVFRNGTKVSCIGEGLRNQYNDYIKLRENNV